MNGPPDDEPRRRWPPLLWAAIALPLWAAIAMLPAALVGAATQSRMPPLWLLIPGLLFATPLILRVDRRVGPETPPALVAPPLAWWTAAALLAGTGATILVSEVGNILLSVRAYSPIVPEGPTVDPWTAALLGLLQPVCLVAVLHGVVQRALAVRLPASWVVAGTIALGAAFGGGGLAVQFGLLLILPTWLFRHTWALLPSAAAILPQSIIPLLAAAGLAPGIPGFDVTSPDEVLWQPIWFNVLGAVLLAAGVGPLMGAFGVGRDDA
ncbi:MAG: hypothetical protein R3F60_26325 [bacterium]